MHPSMFLKNSLRAIRFVTLVTCIICFPCSASCVFSSLLGVCILHHTGNMNTMASVTCVLREENLVMLTFVQTMQCETSHYCAALNVRPILPSTNFFSFNQPLFHYSIDMIFHHMCLYVNAFSHWSHLCGFSAGSKMVWSLYVLPGLKVALSSRAIVRSLVHLEMCWIYESFSALCAFVRSKAQVLTALFWGILNTKHFLPSFSYCPWERPALLQSLCNAWSCVFIQFPRSVSSESSIQFWTCV